MKSSTYAPALVVLATALTALPHLACAQGLGLAGPELASPRGQAAAQVGGAYDSGGTYQGGSWIVVDYGRPILRGRENMFGSGETYGDAFLLGAPIWRVGANQSTRFMTETDLLFGDQRLAAGEYSLFVDLTEDEWTLVFSNWGVKQSFTENNPDALWGAFGYTPDRDVLRTTMEVTTFPVSADQLVILFTDMTGEAGSLSIWWDDQFATVPFRMAP
jgi:hypothetical protein